MRSVFSDPEKICQKQGMGNSGKKRKACSGFLRVPPAAEGVTLNPVPQFPLQVIPLRTVGRFAGTNERPGSGIPVPTGLQSPAGIFPVPVDDLDITPARVAVAAGSCSVCAGDTCSMRLSHGFPG